MKYIWRTKLNNIREREVTMVVGVLIVQEKMNQRKEIGLLNYAQGKKKKRERESPSGLCKTLYQSF